MRFAITVPSKSPALGTLDHKSLVSFVTGGMIDIFGGCTSFQGQGSWKDDKGKVISENVTVVYSYGTPGHVNETHLRQLAAHLCSKAGQDCVLVEVGHTHEFVEVTRKEYLLRFEDDRTVTVFDEGNDDEDEFEAVTATSLQEAVDVLLENVADSRECFGELEDARHIRELKGDLSLVGIDLETSAFDLIESNFTPEQQ